MVDDHRVTVFGPPNEALEAASALKYAVSLNRNDIAFQMIYGGMSPQEARYYLSSAVGGGGDMLAYGYGGVTDWLRRIVPWLFPAKEGSDALNTLFQQQKELERQEKMINDDLVKSYNRASNAYPSFEGNAVVRGFVQSINGLTDQGNLEYVEEGSYLSVHLSHNEIMDNRRRFLDYINNNYR